MFSQWDSQSDWLPSVDCKAPSGYARWLAGKDGAGGTIHSISAHLRLSYHVGPPLGNLQFWLFFTLKFAEKKSCKILRLHTAPPPPTGEWWTGSIYRLGIESWSSHPSVWRMLRRSSNTLKWQKCHPKRNICDTARTSPRLRSELTQYAFK